MILEPDGFVLTQNGFPLPQVERRVDFMDIHTIYAARALPRPSLPEEVTLLISKLKISFKPLFRRGFIARSRASGPAAPDWREAALADVVRKVREKDDADYDEVSSAMNKLSKTNYTKLMTEVLERLTKRDALFRLRVTTLLFDRGVRQTFFATMMADAYKDIAAAHPEALQDLAMQTSMFDTLYDTGNVTLVPASTDAGYNDAIIVWTKQKETKRGFAVYVSELYSRGLVPEDTMMGFLKTIMDDLATSIRTPKTNAHEEHVDALVRFLFAVAPKMPLRALLAPILAIPKADTPSLNMKSRFKLEDTSKASK
jgi:hypothetical protein